MAGWMVRGTGLTDEVTVCELCGRRELRGTVHLVTAEGEEIYAGTSCAARKVGSTAAEVRRRLKVAKMNAEILEDAFARYYRRAFKMSIAEDVAKYGPAAREGIDRVRKQWMRRNGHAA